MKYLKKSIVPVGCILVGIALVGTTSPASWLANKIHNLVHR